VNGVSATELPRVAGDLTIWGLFLQADWVVKLVMILLLLASIWVWAIIFEKWSSLRRANREADGFEDSFWSGGSLDELFRKEGEQPTHPMAAVFVAAMR
jgi:biopolymer transport protein TolQ